MASSALIRSTGFLVISLLMNYLASVEISFHASLWKLNVPFSIKEMVSYRVMPLKGNVADMRT